jgi:hypothetical protein
MQPERVRAAAKQALGHMPEWVMEQVLGAMGMVTVMGTAGDMEVVTRMELEAATGTVPVTVAVLSQTL